MEHQDYEQARLMEQTIHDSHVAYVKAQTAELVARTVLWSACGLLALSLVVRAVMS